MPAYIVPPGPVTFNGPIIPLAVAGTEPPKGTDHKSVSMNIAWTLDGGTNFSIHANLQSQQIVSLDKIRGMYVDNTQCAYYVRIYFSDTQFVLDVAPYSAVFSPIVTALPFFDAWLFAPRFDTGQIITPTTLDVTYFNVLNYAPTPAVVSPEPINPPPVTLYSNGILSGVTSSSLTSILGGGAPIGTLSMGNFGLSGSLNSGARVTVQLCDYTTPAVIYCQNTIGNTSAATINVNQTMFNLSDMTIPLETSGSPPITDNVGLNVIVGGTVAVDIVYNIAVQFQLA